MNSSEVWGTLHVLVSCLKATESLEARHKSASPIESLPTDQDSRNSISFHGVRRMSNPELAAYSIIRQFSGLGRATWLGWLPAPLLPRNLQSTPPSVLAITHTSSTVTDRHNPHSSSSRKDKLPSRQFSGEFGWIIKPLSILGPVQHLLSSPFTTDATGQTFVGAKPFFFFSLWPRCILILNDGMTSFTLYNKIFGI
jgi:hypothetical protein